MNKLSNKSTRASIASRFLGVVALDISFMLNRGIRSRFANIFVGWSMQVSEFKMSLYRRMIIPRNSFTL